MSRLAPLDKALVLILVPIWVVCFSLGVKSQIDGGGFAALGLSIEAPDAYPVLTGGFQRAPHASDPLGPAGLRAGDRLIRLGEIDLRGVGTLGFAARSFDVGKRGLSAPVVYERDGQRFETSLRLGSLSVFRSTLVASLAFVAAALFLLLRAQPTPTVRAQFHAAMALGFANCTFASSSLLLHVWLAFWAIAGSLMHGLAIRFLFRFPDDRVPEGRWHAIWPWGFALPAGLFDLLLFTEWVEIAELGFMLTAILGAIAMLSVATYKYRRGDRVARRQMKWVVFGTYCTVLPSALAATAAALDASLSWLWFVSIWAYPLFPLSLVVSVLRFNLFDVDRILSTTASLNVLAVVLGGGVLIAVPRIAETVSGLIGVAPETSQIILSFTLAALVIPAHRQLRPQIDRLFFKERYALDHGIAELLPTLSACTDARELTERTGKGLHRLLQPDTCIVYAAVEDSYAPVFVEGRAVPPAFGAASPLVASLAERPAPLSLSAAGRRPDEATLGPFDRAALETLQAEVVVPVRQGDALTAFLCLGPKSSGDVYTSTDLSLLAAVAEKVSTELRRFDQEETIREGREMQQALRRYVPGAIAEQLGSGGDLTSGEREVSVLFVDIRGYTSFAESRKAEEIFSTVNRYTETVSQIIQRN
ncbi:MAG: hypothetical protein JRG83_22910, partial [Deltaproteobacteria bacterium]|nr:hypothetical protein [Deltaproteobacteria bacterium]